ncbi:MAG: KOW domain-containing RNA-binding protein [Lachnospiraceae bacterium]|nr:KOW domain-containing RNA-binding protein [Lachnospiraceae bacterium]MDY3728907.1 KOW domain-containing RNA-binding protein [Candidatus Choladocola sp.]
MREWKSEMLAISRAGHDKDTVYVVLKSDDTYLWLADGKRRLLETPKKKKWKHVQVIKCLPDEILSQMQNITLDAHVRRLLADYRKLQEQE